MCGPVTRAFAEIFDAEPSRASHGAVVVHDNYGNDVPPHPGQGWTRFVCISDTHSMTFNLPPGDVLVHTGDLSAWGRVSQLEVTVEWLLSLPHPTKM